MEKPFTSLGSEDCQRSDNSLARCPPLPSVLRAFQEFSRAQSLLIYDTFAMPLTRQVACICELFFSFPLSLPLPPPPFFSFHTIALQREREREGDFNAIDRSVADTFPRDWFDSRRIFESCWRADVVCDIDTRVERLFRWNVRGLLSVLPDKAFNGINRRKLTEEC